MPHPIVIAHHLIWTIYGYWLPNDIRGSSSNVIRKDLLAELGELHHERKKTQPIRSELLRFFDDARNLLNFPVREFTTVEMACVAKAGRARSCPTTCTSLSASIGTRQSR